LLIPVPGVARLRRGLEQVNSLRLCAYHITLVGRGRGHGGQSKARSHLRPAHAALQYPCVEPLPPARGPLRHLVHWHADLAQSYGRPKAPARAAVDRALAAPSPPPNRRHAPRTAPRPLGPAWRRGFGLPPPAIRRSSPAGRSPPSRPEHG